MKIIIGFFFLLFYVSNLNALSLKVGVTGGPHYIIMEKVKELAKAAGLEIQVIEFNDFILPNRALNDQEIDLNIFQHQSYLKEQVKNLGYKIKSVGQAVSMPMGLYSKKIKKLTDLKEYSKIAIPNDPTNEGRALKFLEKEHLIKLKPMDNPSVLDITENAKKFNFLEIDAAQIPRVLDDVDAGITNTDWIMLAKIDPKSALALEDENSAYVNIIAVREDETRPEIEKFIKIYQSEPVKKFIMEKFKGSVLPAW